MPSSSGFSSFKALLGAAAIENQSRAPVAVCSADCRHASTVSGPAAAVLIHDFDVMEELNASDILSGKTKADQVCRASLFTNEAETQNLPDAGDTSIQEDRKEQVHVCGSTQGQHLTILGPGCRQHGAV